MSLTCTLSSNCDRQQGGAIDLITDPQWGGSRITTPDAAPKKPRQHTRFQIEAIRRQIQNGTYDVEGRLDIALDRLLCENGVLC